VRVCGHGDEQTRDHSNGGDCVAVMPVERRERLVRARAARAHRSRGVGLLLISLGVAFFLGFNVVLGVFWLAGVNLETLSNAVGFLVLTASLGLVTLGRRMRVSGAERMLAEDARVPAPRASREAVARREWPADEPGVKLFVDKNLSPQLVSVGHDSGYESTSARDRKLLGAADSDIVAFCIEEDRVCVTNNADDFRELVRDVDLDPGLIVMPNVARETQVQLLHAVLAFIEARGAAEAQQPRDVMLNRVVEVDEAGVYELYELPGR
jgi:predicted nuclease of predicted toxin-antitoxin system